VTRTNITIAVLAILIAVLGVFCYVGKPLLTDQKTHVIVTEGLVIDLDGTNTGQTITNNYFIRILQFAEKKFGPYDGLEPDNIEQISTFLAAGLFVSTVLVGFIASLALFVINDGQQTSVSKVKLVLTVSMVILAGTAIRLILAAVQYGNFDMQSYDIVADIVSRGGNVYAETSRYNYSPVWFLVLFALKKIQLAIPGVPFHFVVRSFLCGVDLLTLGVLLLIAGVRKLPPVRTAIFFYLSPVSFLITGYHGQFENFAMLMVLIGVFIYLRFAARSFLSVMILWLFATAGMIVKHNTLYELVICLHSSVKRYWVKIPLFAVSVVIFLSLFIPYWNTGRHGIIENVFGYGAKVGVYGVTSLFEMAQLKYLFISALFIFPFFLKGTDIIARCLLGTLFFLSFTTGISIQYFVLPVALGAIRPSKLFILYTFVTSCFLLGSPDNLFLPGFNLFRWNIVWIAVVCWFIAEMRLNRQVEGTALEGFVCCEKGGKK
jgi:hypothetical protein